jgi:putative tricarboxylic transport membrane protein
MQAIGRSVPFAVLLGAAVYLLTLTFKFEFPRAPGRLGPDIWPQALLVLLIVACVIGLANSLLAGPSAGSSASSDQPPGAPALLPSEVQSGEPEAPSRYGLVAGGVLLFLAYPIALGYLGFLLATFLLMALFMLLGLWRNVLGVLAVSAAGTLGLFYIFRGVVYVSLPLGVEPFQSATLWVARMLGMH